MPLFTGGRPDRIILLATFVIAVLHFRASQIVAGPLVVDAFSTLLNAILFSQTKVSHFARWFLLMVCILSPKCLIMELGTIMTRGGKFNYREWSFSWLIDLCWPPMWSQVRANILQWQVGTKASFCVGSEQYLSGRMQMLCQDFWTTVATRNYHKTSPMYVS